MAAQWQLSGDYFQNCNCSVVCPCLLSTGPTRINNRLSLLVSQLPPAASNGPATAMHQ